MRAVRIEESTAVRAEVLDDLERGDRALRDDLRLVFEAGRHRVAVEVHRHALPDQDHRADECAGQQDPEHRADNIAPEVANALRSFPREPADERDADREAGGAAEKVPRGERGHLREVAHRVLARIRLPGRRRREADAPC